MKSTPRLSHLIFYVSNPIASAQRWETLLGLTRRLTHETGAYTESEGFGVILGFASHGLGEANYPNDERLRSGSGNTELDIEVEDVDAWHQKAIEAGFTSINPPETQEWGQRTCYLVDPNGIRVAFVTPM